MPIGMPYHLEKGPTLRLIELYLNRPRVEMVAMLGVLRGSKGSIDWFANGLPSLWADPRFAYAPQGSGANVRDDIIRRWFGYERATPTAPWQPGTGPTTGYWIAYKGDVAEIVRKSLTWALELSLGLGPDEVGKGRDRPWPIELFWKCPAPWFEGWVVHRPTESTTNGRDTPGERPERGVVSVLLVTPSHAGSNVAESPLASGPSTQRAGVAHPVTSWQPDYEVLGRATTPGATKPPVAPQDRHFGMWVVTSRDHRTSGVVEYTNNVRSADFAEWGIPQLSVYEGVGEVVAVSPSLPAGGVRWDGAV